MDVSGNSPANDAANSGQVEPRGPGAPKGRPKPTGSGRKKGVPNRVTKQIREIAGKYSQRAVRQAWKLATEAKNQETQLKALELILAYGHGRPAQTQLVGGTGETPVEIEQSDTREASRRMLSFLDNTGILQAIREGVKAEATNGDTGHPFAKTHPQPSAERVREAIDVEASDNLHQWRRRS